MRCPAPSPRHQCKCGARSEVACFQVRAPAEQPKGFTITWQRAKSVTAWFTNDAAGTPLNTTAYDPRSLHHLKVRYHRVAFGGRPFQPHWIVCDGLQSRCRNERVGLWRRQRLVRHKPVAPHPSNVSQDWSIELLGGHLHQRGRYTDGGRLRRTRLRFHYNKVEYGSGLGDA